MPFERQTLPQTVAEVEAGLASRMPGADTRLRRALLAVLSRVVGGIVYGLDAFIAYIAKQILPMSADEDHLPRLARPWRIFRKQADAATGFAIFPGLDGKGMPPQTLMQRGDGVQYESTAEAVAKDDAAQVAVRAVKAGKDGNAAPGTALSLVQPVEGFEFSGTVAASGISGGVDVEDIEDMRGRLITRWQEPPQGGAVTDWKAWALEVPGVTRAWAYARWMGLGTVGVLFVTDEADSPIPDATMVQRVQAYLTDPERKPITADVYVTAPTAKPVDVVIQGLDPATEAVKAAVRAELKDLFRREGEPGRVVLASHIREAISTAVGEYDHTLIAPVNNVYSAKHELPMLGDVHFVDADDLEGQP